MKSNVKTIFPKDSKQVGQILDKIAIKNKNIVADLDLIYGGTWPEAQPAWPESTGTTNVPPTR